MLTASRFSTSVRGAARRYARVFGYPKRLARRLRLTQTATAPSSGNQRIPAMINSGAPIPPNIATSHSHRLRPAVWEIYNGGGGTVDSPKIRPGPLACSHGVLH